MGSILAQYRSREQQPTPAGTRPSSPLVKQNGSGEAGGAEEASEPPEQQQLRGEASLESPEREGKGHSRSGESSPTHSKSLSTGFRRSKSDFWLHRLHSSRRNRLNLMGLARSSMYVEEERDFTLQQLSDDIARLESAAAQLQVCCDPLDQIQVFFNGDFHNSPPLAFNHLLFTVEI